MAIYDNRVCKACGVTFSGGPRAWYCPDCRINRTKKTNLDYHYRKKIGRNRKIGSEDICQNCGKKYIVNSGAQKYCEDCKSQMHKKIDNEQGIDYYYTKIDKKERSQKRRAYYSKSKDMLNLKRRLKYKKDREK